MRQYLSLVIILIGLFCVQTHAQYVVSIDTAMSRNAGKSLAPAVILSLAVPGLGERYLGENSRVKPFIFTDVAGLSAVLITWFAGDRYLTSAKSYAIRHAGAQNPPKSIAFLDVMSQYRSRGGIAGQNTNPDIDDDYNMAMIRSGSGIEDDYAMDATHSWDWGSSDDPATTEHWQTYKSILRNYRISKVAFQVAVGVVVLNRLVSAFDVVRIHRATAGAPLTFQFIPEFSPVSAGADLLFSF
jgi:hypothetical protein